MTLLGVVALYALTAYLLVGAGVGVAVIAVAPRLLPQAAPVTVPARLLLFPGAVALWPILVWRFLATPPSGSPP